MLWWFFLQLTVTTPILDFEHPLNRALLDGLPSSSLEYSSIPAPQAIPFLVSTSGTKSSKNSVDCSAYHQRQCVLDLGRMDHNFRVSALRCWNFDQFFCHGISLTHSLSLNDISHNIVFGCRSIDPFLNLFLTQIWTDKHTLLEQSVDFHQLKRYLWDWLQMCTTC